MNDIDGNIFIVDKGNSLFKFYNNKVFMIFHDFLPK